MSHNAIPPGCLVFDSWEWRPPAFSNCKRQRRMIKTFDGAGAFFGSAVVTCDEDADLYPADDPERWMVVATTVDRTVKTMVSSWTEAKILAERTLAHLASCPNE